MLPASPLPQVHAARRHISTIWLSCRAGAGLVQRPEALLAILQGAKPGRADCSESDQGDFAGEPEKARGTSTVGLRRRASHVCGPLKLGY